MSIAEQHNVPAAWYPDQSVPNQLRWWDGRSWTSDVRPLEAPTVDATAAEVPVAQTPLPETRRGLHAVATAAQGFGHATADQLRTWPAPEPDTRSDVDALVREVPRAWANNESVDAIKGFMAKAAEPVDHIPLAATRIATPASSWSAVTPLNGPVEEVDLSNWQPATPESTPEPAASALSGPPASAVDVISEGASRRLAAVPPFDERAADEPTNRVQPDIAVALTRRQLRELVGGPLTTGAEAQ